MHIRAGLGFEFGDAADKIGVGVDVVGGDVVPRRQGLVGGGDDDFAIGVHAVGHAADEIAGGGVGFGGRPIGGHFLIGRAPDEHGVEGGIAGVNFGVEVVADAGYPCIGVVDTPVEGGHHLQD